jgi:hypothetical protein
MAFGHQRSTHPVSRSTAVIKCFLTPQMPITRPTQWVAGIGGSRGSILVSPAANGTCAQLGVGSTSICTAFWRVSGSCPLGFGSGVGIACIHTSASRCECPASLAAAELAGWLTGLLGIKPLLIGSLPRTPEEKARYIIFKLLATSFSLVSAAQANFQRMAGVKRWML